MLQEILSASGFANRDPTHDDWYEPRGGMTTHAGIDVTPVAAIKFSSVFACIQKIAKTIASLPVHVYEKTGVRETRLVDHELNEILDWRGNSRATGITVRSSMTTNRLAWGNGVAEITYTNGGKIAALTPLMSKYLRPIVTPAGELHWEHRPDGQYDTTLPPGKYLHDPGPFSLNGLIGISPIASTETIGGAIATQTFVNTFFGNGAVPGGFLEFPAELQLSDERQDALVEKFNETWQGSKRAHKIGRLREGVTFKQIGMPLEDMQLLESRKFNRIEICSIFDVPPILIQELDPGKYTAIEQAMIMWVRDSLLPQCKSLEAVYKRVFFPDSNLYVKHNLAGLMRGDMKAQAEFFKAGIQWGWFTVNDVREMMEFNSVEGGDINWIQMNMMSLTSEGQLVGPPKAPPKNGDDNEESARRRQPVIVVNMIGQSRERDVDSEAIGRQVAESVAISLEHPSVDASAAFGPILGKVAERIVAKEDRAVKNALKRYTRNEEAYATWCDDFFTKHAELVRKEIEPVVCGIERVSGRTAAERPADFAARYAERQHASARNIPGGVLPVAGYLLSELTATYLTENIPCLN